MEVRGCATLMGASEFTYEAAGREVRGCATLIASELPHRLQVGR